MLQNTVLSWNNTLAVVAALLLLLQEAKAHQWILFFARSLFSLQLFPFFSTSNLMCYIKLFWVCYTFCKIPVSSIQMYFVLCSLFSFLISISISYISSPSLFSIIHCLISFLARDIRYSSKSLNVYNAIHRINPMFWKVMDYVMYFHKTLNQW